MRPAEKDRQETTRQPVEKRPCGNGRGLSAWLWLCRGLASGYVAFFWCKLSTHASVIDISVLILSVYFVFYLGEHFFHVSGVLAAVSFGILFSHHAPHGAPDRLLTTFLAGLRFHTRPRCVAERAGP